MVPCLFWSAHARTPLPPLHHIRARETSSTCASFRFAALYHTNRIRLGNAAPQNPGSAHTNPCLLGVPHANRVLFSIVPAIGHFSFVSAPPDSPNTRAPGRDHTENGASLPRQDPYPFLLLLPSAFACFGFNSTLKYTYCCTLSKTKFPCAINRTYLLS